MSDYILLNESITYHHIILQTPKINLTYLKIHVIMITLQYKLEIGK